MPHEQYVPSRLKTISSLGSFYWFAAYRRLLFTLIPIECSSNLSVSLFGKKTSRERPKLASYLRLKNLHGTTIGKTWQEITFFSKKLFGKKSRLLPKNPKRGHLGPLNVFYKPKTFKKFKGVPFDRIQKFSENVA